MSSIKIRTKQLDGMTQIRTLINHPMETGRNRDKNGQLIAAHYIQKLTIKHNDVIIMSCEMGAGISKDPFFVFHLKGGSSGDKITISWIDNLGNSDTSERLIR